jgi:hypothetical protein
MATRHRATVVAVAFAALVASPIAQARHGNPAEEGIRQPPTRVITVKAANTFDWADAGVGIGGTLGVLVAATGTGLLLQRYRNRTRVA